MKIVSFFFLLYIIQQATAARDIKIGGLFDTIDTIQEQAFQYAVEDINEKREILPRHSVVAKTEFVPKDDSFAVSQAVCNLLRKGVVGVFGPASTIASRHVQSVCDAKEVPHVETHMDPTQGRGSCLINFFPHPTALSRVFVDLVKAWDWKSFMILYENTNSFPRLSELIKMHDVKGPTISYKQLDYGSSNYRPILQQVKKSGETNFVLDCSADKLYDILIQAQQVGILSDQHSYIITTTDLHTLDLEPFRYSGVNMTGIRLIDPEDQDVKDVVEIWNTKKAQEGKTPEEEITPEHLSTDIALMFDAVRMFATCLQELNLTKFHSKNFDCDDTTSWEHGFTMVNYMKTNYMKGLTRGIRFDNAGFRTDFLLDIVKLSGLGIEKIGTWNSTVGLNLTGIDHVYQIPAESGSLVNRSFIVLTALSPPYGMRKESSVTLEGNDRFEGFGIELIQEIAKMLGFNYTFQLQEDGVYGSLNRKTNDWNGMVRKLLDWEADLAITDLTITSDRESAVDFTMPFMHLGISILYKKPSKQPPSLFSFMSPFSNEVWLFLGTAYLGVSILLFVSGRIAPKEWNNPYPCIEEPDHLENQFSMANSLWFTVGSVLQQGSELAPIAISTRMIAGVWWFFTLIMVSSYTANLAAFLTVESTVKLIDSAEDLVDNPHGIVYGSKRDGSTLSFFKDADYPAYQKISEFMSSNPEALTSTNDEGVLRVKNENYAYFMESTSIEYIIERNCDLAQVGGMLDDKGYGIAMRKNSPYRNTLSTAVLKLQEQGKLQAMKMKWWKEKRGGGACSGVEESSSSVALTLENVGGVFVVLVAGSFLSTIVTIIDWMFDIWMVAREHKETSDESPAELGLSNVGGVFVVLLAGCTLATIVSCGEMICGIIKNSAKYKLPFHQELKEEWKFVIKCSGDTKPVRHRRSSSPSSRSGSRASGDSSKSKEDLNETFELKVPENGNGNNRKS